jgi:hypothetical protein
MYSSVLDTIGTTAAIDLFELLAPADAAVVIHELRLSQSTEFGDVQAEQLEILLKRVTGAPTSGSGGTANANPLAGGQAAAGSICEAGNTTKLTGGTQVNLLREAWNVSVGFFWIPTPETRIIISPSTRLVVELITTPNDAIDLHGTLIFEEIGG